ncbi:HAD family phosphatase [Saccharothrix violaceirubra]|uniref:Putative hydrolase of the HAD superfamily n=1 Tax=Saccharothrix violaceirubra TaxID=413306 RepID=A0A7W7X044_9PSEU|nr:HAD family phosphatase [Saccharothrix violaceirubra]MBB4969511.1 putative hydrolase of the HAD superfamily [Saccharothrix violaceirubra]
MRWVVFDYGQVVSRPHVDLPGLAAAMGVPLEDFLASYWAHRDAYDRGDSDLVYWRAVGGGVGVDVSEEFARRLADQDTAGWLHPDPDAVALIAELDAAGVPLALLSNASHTFGRAAEKQPWTRHFRHLMFSADLGTAKPDPEIWTALADRIGARPRDCVFFDDRVENVDGALRAGLTGLLWQGTLTARTALAGLSLP